MLRVPQLEIDSRICNLQRQLFLEGIDGAILCQGADLFYYTGSTQNGFLFVPQGGEATFYVKKSWKRAVQETTIKVVPVKSMKQLPPMIIAACGKSPRKLGLEFDVLPVSTWMSLQPLFPSTQFVDVSTQIRNQRAVKSPWEIARLETSAQLLKALFEQASGLLRPNMSELDYARELEYVARGLGHQGLVRMRAFNQDVFMGQAMAGESSAMASSFDGPAGGRGLSPAYPIGASTHLIRKGQPVLVDFSAVVDGYTADMTRILCLGDLDNELADAHQVSIDILTAVMEAAKPGVSWTSLYNLSVELAAQAGLAHLFMGCGDDQAKFVGHGVGIELDELPIMAKGFETSTLKEGMVFALEPKFVFSDKGVVGVEDTCLVTKDGAIPLTFVDRGIIYVK